MTRLASKIAALGLLLSGCVTAPAPQVTPAPVQAAPVSTMQDPNTAEVEQEYLRKAQDLMRDRRWADALIHWEILALLKPSAENYRNEIAALQKRIRNTAAELLQAADLARKRGNISQAILGYLRVLNVDRENAPAAQALRELEQQRVQHQYLNRAPRKVM